jgi:predicted metal-dependent HD superfamily phosphohydrolase
MKYAQLMDQLKQEVTRFFKSNNEKGFTYHSLEHTESVVANVNEIGGHYGLDEKDLFIVNAAAWFHDTGYYNGGAVDHELRGADKAAHFLMEKGVDEEIIKSVRGCIMATRIPQSPNTLLEKIVCDSDLYHLGTDRFPEQNKLMRKEAEWRQDRKIPKDEWRHNTIHLFEVHHYQTDFARNLLEQGKQHNLKKLKQKLTNTEGGTKEEKQYSSIPVKNPAPLAIHHPPNPAIQEAPAKKQKSDRPDRGIETMFRISSNNHQRLSDMADNKAHIMITTTSIIISVLLSVLLRKLEDNPHLLIPTLLLLGVCVSTMVFCILATRPSLPPGTFTQDDMNAKKVNLLFFGNFYRMTYDEYSDGMRKVMNDRDFLYGSLTRDVYSQGIVLGRKYRLLRKGYSIFMYGVIISVLAFIIAVVFFK